MTTEQPSPEAQEHRKSRWWPFDGVPRPGLIEAGTARLDRPGEPGLDARLVALAAQFADSADGGPGAAGPGPANPAEPPGNGSVIEGEVLTDDQRAARELAHQREQAESERLPLSPTFRQELRMQLADFAERAHQKRLRADGPELLGSGGGITEAVVQAMAEAISAENLPSPAGSADDRVDLLLGALAATDPKQVSEAGHVSFVTLRGRLMLDVSTAAIDGESLSTRFVRLPSRSGAPEHDAAAMNGAANNAADQRAAGSPADGDWPARYAAVISGSAAVIAGGRPFLGMDALTTYARRQAFSSLSDETGPQAARRGMQAAHNIEIVVLLDRSLDGGVWVDVDPETGSPKAAMLIAVRPAGFRFTPLAAA
jgi:hypothetical protein